MAAPSNRAQRGSPIEDPMARHSPPNQFYAAFNGFDSWGAAYGPGDVVAAQQQQQLQQGAFRGVSPPTGPNYDNRELHSRMHDLMHELSDVMTHLNMRGTSPPQNEAYGVPALRGARPMPGVAPNPPMPIGGGGGGSPHRDTSPAMDYDMYMQLMMMAVPGEGSDQVVVGASAESYHADPWQQHGAVAAAAPAAIPVVSNQMVRGRGRGNQGDARGGRGGGRGGARGAANGSGMKLLRVDPAILAVTTTETEAAKAMTADTLADARTSSIILPNKVYVVVEFKNQRLKRYECNPSIAVSPGRYVIVDGDRGEDCGLVVLVGRTSSEGTLHVQQVEGTSVQLNKLKTEHGQVLRIAESNEVDTLHTGIATLEQNALKICREKCREYGLDINVIDCEYQFDGKKISFYFDSERSIDFRDIVKDLFKIFGARIWMENVNAKVKNVVPTGAVSKHQKAPGGGGGRGGGHSRGGGHHHH